MLVSLPKIGRNVIFSNPDKISEDEVKEKFLNLLPISIDHTFILTYASRNNTYPLGIEHG